MGKNKKSQVTFLSKLSQEWAGHVLRGCFQPHLPGLRLCPIFLYRGHSSRACLCQPCACTLSCGMTSLLGRDKCRMEIPVFLPGSAFLTVLENHLPAKGMEARGTGSGTEAGSRRQKGHFGGQDRKGYVP